LVQATGWKNLLVDKRSSLIGLVASDGEKQSLTISTSDRHQVATMKNVFPSSPTRRKKKLVWSLPGKILKLV
jgi:hypothetical protein